MAQRKDKSFRRRAERRPPVAPQEKLVHDARAGLSPAQMVEQKLVTLLHRSILPASHLQSSRTRRALS